ncbi:hypothetical protein J4H92_04025 [Leucobacter weissii]|uniref:Uncharacterized protein n=1 Tax=Leucobacter weissii TaxID=1983706 RepID=A0A939MIZ5_9MICO|nr:hypothetical protein [Leucobacter weissii]MBO1901115.1 hypothetical protein [Leucobacter weissii]
MRLEARLVNLLGLLVLVGVLALGIVLIALPMYERGQEANREIADSEQINAGYRAQLGVLNDAEARRGEIERSIAQVRRQIPEGAEYDSALELIENALEEEDGFVKLTAFGEPADFAPRPDPTADEGDDGEPAPPADPAAEDPAAASGTEAPAAGAADAEPPADPRQQIELTIEIAVPDVVTATAILDELRAGPRLLLVTSAKVEREEDEERGMEGRLTVTAQIFNRTGADS